jgi:hypothetical protein
MTVRIGQYSRPGQTKITRRIGQEEMVAGTGQGCHNRTARIVISEQDCQDDCQDDCQSKTARTGLSGRVARTGLLGQDGHDKTAKQNNKERTARTEELEKYSQKAQPMDQVEEDS